LVVGQIVTVTGCVGVSGVNGGFYAVETVIDQDNITLSISGNSGTYLGLGVAAVVDNFIIQTKAFDDGVNKGMGVCISSAWLQLQTNSTEGSTFAVSAYADTSSSTSSFGSVANGYIPVYLPAASSSPNTADGYNEDQASQEYIWKEVVVNCTGSSISLLVTRLIPQILEQQTSSAPITINGILLKMAATSRLVN
jgi:hypothetical protein